MLLGTIPVIIANGQNSSDVVDLGGKILVGIQMPSAWTTANLAFQASFDGTTFNEFVDTGIATIGVSAAPGRFIAFASDKVHQFYSVRWLKILSTAIGNPNSPVNQEAERTLQLITRPFGCSITVNC